MIITGAASGIGATAAAVFSRHGARVACLDRDLAGATRVAQALPGA
ncbi:MAG: SDR family NAD(P)-dependent oxidoreductase, partial [Polymorphobacter sp.]